MSTGPVAPSPRSDELSVHDGPVRPAAGAASNLGVSPNGNNTGTESAGGAPAIAEDAVEVQWDSTDRIEVYQFVNQEGSLILQVPSSQMLNIARQISEELAQDAANAAAEGVKADGS